MALQGADIIYQASDTYPGDFAIVFDDALPNVGSAYARLGRLVDTIVNSCGVDPLIATKQGLETKIAAIDGLKLGYLFGRKLVMHSEVKVTHG